jgi:hypothetical protein
MQVNLSSLMIILYQDLVCCGDLLLDTCHQEKSSVHHPAFLLLHTIGSIYLLNPRGTSKTHSFLGKVYLSLVQSTS